MWSPRQDDDIARARILDDIHVLVHGVCRAGIPHVLAHPLRRGQHVEAFVALGAQEVPAARQVPDQAMRLVLCRHRNAADAGIDRVGQREIDDARFAAKIDGRLGASVGQLHQPRAASPLPAHRPWPRGPAVMVLCSLPFFLTLHDCPFSGTIAPIRPRPAHILETALIKAAGRFPPRPASARPRRHRPRPRPGCRYWSRHTSPHLY